MRRISALVCVIMMAMALLAPAAMAAENSSSAQDKSGFTIESTSPEDGTEGVAVDNLSIKIYFSKNVTPKNKKIRTENQKQFRLKDAEGEKVPVKVYYSEEEEGLILVAADTFSSKSKSAKVKGDMGYTLSIGKGFQATDGTKLGNKETISVKTLNQGRSTAVYMILMALMMVGMVIFALRGNKKEEKKEREAREAKDGVNPYKAAKKSGKSVEEIVAKENKKKQKKEEAIRKQKEAEAAIEAEIIEKIRRENNKRVSAPKSIKAAGSKYRIKVVTDAGAKVENPKESVSRTNKGTTNPKNQSGKNRNKKNKGKKKK